MARLFDRKSGKSAAKEFTLLPNLLRIIEEAGPLPMVAWRMVHAVEDGRATAFEVTDILEDDPLVSRRVMRYANGAQHAQLGPVSSLSEGVYRLGSLAILKMIFTDFLRNLDWAAPIYRLPSADFGRHAEAASAAAVLIGRYASDTGISRLAPIAAMMHDIGKVMIARCMEKDGPGRLNELGGATRVFADIEREVVGLDHAETGALLARRWGLPAVVVHAIHDHHRLGPENHEPTSVVVALADVIARSVGHGAPPDSREVRQCMELQKRIGLDRDDFYRIRTDLSHQLDYGGGGTGRAA
jgi:putative nucleotidyltransferase with HDIG domain